MNLQENYEIFLKTPRGSVEAVEQFASILCEEIQKIEQRINEIVTHRNGTMIGYDSRFKAIEQHIAKLEAENMRLRGDITVDQQRMMEMRQDLIDRIAAESVTINKRINDLVRCLEKMQANHETLSALSVHRHVELRDKIDAFKTQRPPAPLYSCDRLSDTGDACGKPATREDDGYWFCDEHWGNYKQPDSGVTLAAQRDHIQRCTFVSSKTHQGCDKPATHQGGLANMFWYCDEHYAAYAPQVQDSGVIVAQRPDRLWDLAQNVVREQREPDPSREHISSNFQSANEHYVVSHMPQHDDVFIVREHDNDEDDRAIVSMTATDMDRIAREWGAYHQQPPHSTAQSNSDVYVVYDDNDLSSATPVRIATFYTETAAYDFAGANHGYRYEIETAQQPAPISTSHCDINDVAVRLYTALCRIRDVDSDGLIAASAEELDAAVEALTYQINWALEALDYARPILAKAGLLKPEPHQPPLSTAHDDDAGWQLAYDLYLRVTNGHPKRMISTNPLFDKAYDALKEHGYFRPDPDAPQFETPFGQELSDEELGTSHVPTGDESSERSPYEDVEDEEANQ